MPHIQNHNIIQIHNNHHVGLTIFHITMSVPRNMDLNNVMSYDGKPKVVNIQYNELDLETLGS